MNATLAPVCLFVFKRLDLTKQVLASLQNNQLAAQSHLYIFSDAAAKEEDKKAVEEVRSFISNITGFASVTLRLSDENKGLANSVIAGVSEVVNEWGKAIVLEDDLVLSNNFLHFMNDALNWYENDERVFSVCGYTVPIRTKENLDVYFTGRGSSWGWATWKNRWDKIDWTMNDYNQFKKNKAAQKRFNRNGSDLTKLLRLQMEGKRNSWAIRWAYAQFKLETYAVFPIVSKVANDGFGGNATHTAGKHQTRFSTGLDKSGKTKFQFLSPYIHPDIFKQFTDTYSLKTRILYKLKGLFA
ncbi:MAG: sugar transferase [Bacteroidota bacterium]|nr:sugar transferase [Bacteroidota bacterium]